MYTKRKHKPEATIFLDGCYFDLDTPYDWRHVAKLKNPLTNDSPISKLSIDAGIHPINLNINDTDAIASFIRKTKSLTYLKLGRLTYPPASTFMRGDQAGTLTSAIRLNTSLTVISIHVDLLEYPFLIDSIIENQHISEVCLYDDYHHKRDTTVESVLYRLISEKKNMTSLQLDARRQFSCTKFIGALADNTTLMELALPRCELTYQDVEYLASVLQKNNHLKSLTITSGYTGKELVLNMLKKKKSLTHVNLYGSYPAEKFSKKMISLYDEVDSFLRRNRITFVLYCWMMISLLKADKGVICAAQLISVYSHMLAINMSFCTLGDDNQIVVDLLWMRNLRERFMWDFPGLPQKGRSQEKMRLQDFSLLGHSLFQVPANAAEAFKGMLVEKKAIPCIRNYLSERGGQEHGGITRAGSLLQVLCSPDVTLNCKLLVLDAFISKGVGTIGVDKGTDLVKDLRKCFKLSSESKCIKDTAQLYAKDNQLDLLQAERLIIKKINGLLACEQITDAYLLHQKSFWSLTFG